MVPISNSKYLTHSHYPLVLSNFQHGSHFVKLRQYECAEMSLNIALKSTNSSLCEIRKELKGGVSKGTQILYNLEAELVVLSVEASYLLSVSYQSSGEKDKAIMTLDRIQGYMEEQHARDNELHSKVMTTLGTHEGN
jgi:hypothetical protein